jgi:hypothetical protein
MISPMATLRPGTRLRSLVCSTEVVVVRAPAGEIALTCGGQPMLTPDDPRKADAAPGGADGEGTLLGKRYEDADAGVELLCTKAGAGELAVDGRALVIKGAKPLPSTD